MTPALALHCALASGAAWRGVAGALPDVEILAPDLPGHGRAPDPGGAADLMAESLAVAEAALPPGPVHLVGHSYGACVAMRLLVARPERVKTLTLIEPVMFAAAEASALANHLNASRPFADALARGARKDAARAFNRMWGGLAWEDLPPRHRAEIASRIHLIGQSEPGIVQDAHGILPRLPACAHPVQIIVQPDPPAIMSAIVAGLRARLPDTRLARAGQDHMVPITHPAEVATLLRGFWGEVAPGKARAG